MMLQGKTVLIVDDEPDLRDLLAFEFEELNCEILQAESGREGIRVFDEHAAVDVVLSDIRMPGGSGLELLDHIKKTKPEVPVFLITGFADVTEEQALQRGAVKLFHKPFDIDEIIQAANGAVSRKAS